ncbi:MAG TPA: phage Gp37/Gp68 family protein [Chthoniobacterales bacterium]|jgi:protein gp37|nr:phage Gp37/Gp68 family protein [Chthoniobacterales bacterium]
MAANSHIEWTQATWNPVTGCTKISAGCKNCYAERLAFRLEAMGNRRYRNGFRVTLHDDVISLPKSWRIPRMIFVNSMSDLFHKDVPLEFIQRVFATMRNCSQHTFQILTKRSERLRNVATQIDWPPNVWMGVSVEDSRVLSRVEDLRKVPAAIRFLSCEPLIGSLVELDLTDIHWVIVGGESGPYARPMRNDWVLEIFRACRKADVPFFFKQWGGVRKDLTGRLLRGRTYDEMPQHIAA